ncbi:hypothetical protein [Microbacterium sp. CFBP 8794]|uniref:hypothetical protein n=1 Tax=Microbacterium sp. CFBP 8794 TaxID=2775269 RepID=UPI00177E8711|nr:hypothetical protein [Microbacterium sp. CFBP 8794]MBD8477599.1 hypothetical protein [Microbacterium sp. CFBP 8794]
MNAQEANVLLTKAALLDGRFRRAPEDLAQMSIEWSLVLGDVHLGPAIDALRIHYRGSAQMIMPSDVRAITDDMAPDAAVRLADGPQWLRAHGVDAERFQARLAAGERPTRILRELGAGVGDE